MALHSDNQRTCSIVKTVASLGADLNAVDGDDWMPLRVAVDLQNLEALQALVDAGADLELRDNEAEGTPLHFAAVYHSYEDVARILMEHGAKASPCEGVEPLYYSHLVLNRELEILKLALVAGADPGTVYDEDAVQRISIM